MSPPSTDDSSTGAHSASDWRSLNRANWDERVAIHRAIDAYGNGSHADGSAFFHPIEAAELGPVAGLRVLHLQCHFGHDTLILAQQGADVTGLDFSLPAIEAARADAARFGIPARFVHADLYDAPAALTEPASFDRVFTTWGTIGWLPDIDGWARVVAHFLKPGGRLYFADMHPIAAVFDEAATGPDGRPHWAAPYFLDGPLLVDDASDYADPDAVLVNSRMVQFIHPVAGIVGALLKAGLRLDFLHEHPILEWQQFPCLVQDANRSWTWPDRPWFPLSLSIGATKT